MNNQFLKQYNSLLDELDKLQKEKQIFDEKISILKQKFQKNPNDNNLLSEIKDYEQKYKILATEFIKLNKKIQKLKNNG